MGGSVDLQTAPDSDTRTEGVVDDREGSVVVDGEVISLVPLDNVSHLPQWCGQYRDVCGNFSCVRVIAVSAIVVGILFATAPTALAPVGLLLASAPAASAEHGPVRDDATADTDDSAIESPVQSRSGVRSVAALITWDGTSRALKCSYGLLVEGNTRICKTI
jgi:hypothetical protein